MKKIVVLSGAGISAESGIKTFRDADGLWEGHDITEVASPEGFTKNPELVLNFYNLRRRQLLEVQPNLAHQLLADLEQYYPINIITQNVDDLHERAGNKNVLHLHGELLKARSSKNENYVVEWHSDINMNNLCPDGYLMRPHIVWFGETVPEFDRATDLISQADIVIVIGTSMQVYPAAGLIQYATKAENIFYIDPKPAYIHLTTISVETIAEKATTGMEKLFKRLISSI
ncbi:SIR2 family NAD-dependent protein deacylase [Avrilella dinanensis]|uniref:NAD-dependent protein deacylase n=1 Tax=Avrilella dinanensis TaxID=2008672 RepID=A0A2M9R3V1_9FLAO|nr:NAD-dependent deacylase [Avrilella dinanensis]PJR03403.1 NAD-dependent protein deacylase [Avrilella dinanensis]